MLPTYSEQVSKQVEQEPFDQPVEGGLRSPKILLIDDDPVFVAIMQRWATIEGVHLEAYASLDEMGFIGLFANYDVAIIDFDLGYITGLEIARCTDKILQQMPIVIISAKDRSGECSDAPTCVKAILNKSSGYNHILSVALKLCRKSVETRLEELRALSH